MCKTCLGVGFSLLNEGNKTVLIDLNGLILQIGFKNKENVWFLNKTRDRDAKVY